MKFFVTGAAGYLGKAICSSLIENNHEVAGFDLIDSDLKNTRYLHVKGNINNKNVLKEALHGCNWIIHSAVFRGDYSNNLKNSF